VEERVHQQTDGRERGLELMRDGRYQVGLQTRKPPLPPEGLAGNQRQDRHGGDGEKPYPQIRRFLPPLDLIKRLDAFQRQRDLPAGQARTGWCPLVISDRLRSRWRDVEEQISRRVLVV